MASQHIIYIMDFTGKTHAGYYNLSNTIGDMKKQIEEKLGYPSGLRYICNSKQYDDDSLLITEIKYESIIHIVGRLL